MDTKNIRITGLHRFIKNKPIFKNNAILTELLAEQRFNSPNRRGNPFD